MMVLSLFKKPTQGACYINTGLNHTKQLFKQIRKSMITRFSSNSSISIFNKNKVELEQTLKIVTRKPVHNTNDEQTRLRGKKMKKKDRKIFYCFPRHGS